MNNEKPIHILRYGTVADKVHLEKSIDSFDYLSINGNTAAYVSNAIAKFVVEKFFTKENKGFFIDPITYAFQKNLTLLYSKSDTTNEKKLKKSVKKLIDIYGEPIKKVLDNEEVLPSDFTSNNIEYFCKRVLEFQYSIVHNHLEQNDLQKYIEYISPNIKSKISQFKPKFLIAPYFYLDCKDIDFSKWLNLNTKLVEIAMKLSKDCYSCIDVFAQIVINKETLCNETAINEIITKYNMLNCSGITIWVDDFNEHQASNNEIIRFTKFLKSLKIKPIYNMYGGYYSILLTNKNVNLLNGVSHGLEYGESRKVYPVGGGIPVSKYYYLPLHQRLDFTKSFYLLEHEKVLDIRSKDWGNCDKYYSDICQCSRCREIMQNQMINFIEFESTGFYEVHLANNQVLRRKKASRETKINCLYHYLLCKNYEFNNVFKNDIDELLNKLVEEKSKYISCKVVEYDELSYVDNWVTTIQMIKEDLYGK